ncbi:MAG: hypothetical protein JSS49_07985 [Planctomycetes bacterium]|nr:hypothetical protein [Planctomycetota bacterium]
MSDEEDRKPAKGQREFDYERVDRRNMVKHLRIPPFNYVNSRGRRVFVQSTKAMRLLLIAIEDYCGQTPDKGWWLYLEEIAKTMGQAENEKGEIETRTASRAVSACCGAGLLIVTRESKNTARSHYQIVWSRVGEVLHGNPETAKWALDDSKSEVTTPHDKSKAPHDKLSWPHDKLSSPHDKLSCPPAEHTISSRARALHHECNQQSNHHGGKPSPKRYATYAGWPFKIELPHLKNSESVLRLWKAALDRTDVDLCPGDRVKFFALARYVGRLAALGEIANPGGYFHAQLIRDDRRPNWLGEPMDYEAAAKAVAIVDCRERETPADRAAREGRRK